jgi:YfiH family protein
MIPPGPQPPFAWRRTGANRLALVCHALGDDAAHVFTTGEWPLGVRSEQPQAAADLGWTDVADALHLDSGALVRAKQMHGTGVLLVDGTPPGPAEADILVSTDRRMGVAVQTADCAPVLLADLRGRGVAAVHAGWRGLAAGVLPKGVRALAERAGCRPADLVAAVGPCIGPCCYEVGDEVRRQFRDNGFAPGRIDAWFRRAAGATSVNPSLPGLPCEARAGRWYLDVWQAAVDQLADSGVPAAQIHVAGLCTASHPRLFCSYRRDSAGTGRMAAAIRLAPPPDP